MILLIPGKNLKHFSFIFIMGVVRVCLGCFYRVGLGFTGQSCRLRMGHSSKEVSTLKWKNFQVEKQDLTNNQKDI